MYFTRLISISRPRFWMYTFGSYLIGISAYSTVSGAVIADGNVFLWLLYLTFPVNIFVYGINDLADVDTDAFNQKKGEYEVAIRRHDRRMLITTILLSHIVFLPAFFFSSFAEIICIALFILTNIAYSLPPLRLKAVPYLDSAINGVFCSAIGCMGYFAAGGQEINWLPVIAGALWSAVMHAYSAIPDIEADTKAGIQTIATKLGVYGTLLLCICGYIIAGICLILGGWWSVSVFVIPYIILILWSFYVYKQKHSIFTVYKIYPLVTLCIGGLIYLLNTWQ